MPNQGAANDALRKAKFVEGIAAGMPDAQAARYAGLSSEKSALTKLRSERWVAEQLQNLHGAIQNTARVTRSQVEEIVLEAVDIARIKAEPGDMIRGASELSKMNGFYAPEKKEISIDADIAVRRLETMSDAELLAMQGKQQSDIEAEFERVGSVPLRGNEVETDA